MLKFFANIFWIYTPGLFQKKFSQFFSWLFFQKISKYFILPYCLFFGLDADYLEQFESESGKSEYSSYADFFKRKYKNLPPVESNQVWPCEGFVYDWGSFKEKNHSVVKGQEMDLNQIFNSPALQTKNYFFTNIFLHNHNYHRVHSPITGTITKIFSIPGDLVFLRPWFYKKSDVSYPAFRNERIVFEIQDLEGVPWYLAMVGGFGVGTMTIEKDFLQGGPVHAGQEIAKFDLGSTVCLASPCQLEINKYLQTVSVGQSLPLKA